MKDRKTFNRLNSPLGTATNFTARRSRYKSNPFGITGFRFPGLRSQPNPNHNPNPNVNGNSSQQLYDPRMASSQDTKEKDKEHKRQRSFLDMDVAVEPPHPDPNANQNQHAGISGLNCFNPPRPLSISIGGERRIMPIHHSNMGGESPLSELVRYSPHDAPYQQTHYQHQHDHEHDQSAPFESFGRHRAQLSNSGSGRTGMTAGSGWILGPTQPQAVSPSGTAAAAGHTWPRPSGPGGAV